MRTNHHLILHSHTIPTDYNTFLLLLSQDPGVGWLITCSIINIFIRNPCFALFVKFIQYLVLEFVIFQDSWFQILQQLPLYNKFGFEQLQLFDKMLNMETEIFIQQNPEHSQNINIFDVQTFQSSIPYLKKGDSSLYIGQFLTNDEEEHEKIMQAVREKARENELFEISSQSQHSESRQRNDNTQQSQHSSNQQHQASVFHNFQKHLTIALRMIVDLTHIDADRDSVLVAKKLWKIFKESTVTAKKMLHYILGEKNQHSINTKLLEKYGFREVYEQHPEWLINEAKAFLRIEALNQLKDANLTKYTSKRRIKNQEYFILYVKEFMTQLEQGFLKKRIKKEKVLKD